METELGGIGAVGRAEEGMKESERIVHKHTNTHTHTQLPAHTLFSVVR